VKVCRYWRRVSGIKVISKPRVPMMSETTVLEARVDKIERDNRRLKLTVGALLLVLAAIPLIGAVMPEQVQDAVFARAFYVEDENGITRAAMNDLGIAYYDENGTTRATMADVGIWFNDENGNGRASMSDLGIGYRDENGNIRVTVDDDGITYWDENGNTVWMSPSANQRQSS
jgi:hypothetical protein